MGIGPIAGANCGALERSQNDIDLVDLHALAQTLRLVNLEN